MKEVLLIDSDMSHQKICKEFLEQNHIVHTATSAIEAIKIVELKNIGLIISEIEIGAIDGFQLFEIIKHMYPSIKFMIHTHDCQVSLELKGMDLGINQYIHKKTSLEIFKKWVEILLKHDNDLYGKDQMNIGKDLQIDLVNHKIFKDGVLVKITKKEFELLKHFIRNKNKVLEREEIAKAVWKGRNPKLDNRVVDSCIKCLRSKLNLNTIRTISGVGYEWVDSEN